MIGLVCFAIILASWFGGVKYPKAIPAGLVAIAAGMLIAWGSNAVRPRTSAASASRALGEAFANFGFSVPLPAFGQVFSRLRIPRHHPGHRDSRSASTIWSRPWTMSRARKPRATNIPTTRVLTADGVVSLIGCLMGNPFINAVYIGHPGWKAMGGRIGYSAATGIMVMVLSLVRHHLGDAGADPGRRDLADPALHRHADRRAGVPGHAGSMRRRSCWRLMPHLAAWAKLQIDSALGRPCRQWRAAADKVGAVKAATIARCASRACSITGWKCWAAARSSPGWCSARSPSSSSSATSSRPSAFAAAGAVLTFFGFMHGEAVGIGGGLGVTPGVALAYALVAAVFFALAKLGTSALPVSHPETPLAAPAE